MATLAQPIAEGNVKIEELFNQLADAAVPIMFPSLSRRGHIKLAYASLCVPSPVPPPSVLKSLLNLRPCLQF